MLNALILSVLMSSSDSIRITGNCYNVADQTKVNCSVTVVFNTRQQKIITNNSGVFAFEAPDSVRYLTFQSLGFETRTVSVNRIGSDRRKAPFSVEVPMIKDGMDPVIKEDEVIFPKSQLFINIEAPDSTTLGLVLMDRSKRKVQENRPIISSFQSRILTMNYVLPGSYMLSIGTFALDNQRLVKANSQEEVLLLPGFNFISITHRDIGIHNSTAILKPKTLYFDQSSYNLRKDSRLILDSVCAELVRRHNLVALVTGHTDNVGKSNLNLILSEYRARVVRAHMDKYGVRPGQIYINWKGSNAPVAPNDTEENKRKNRRVEIQLTKNN